MFCIKHHNQAEKPLHIFKQNENSCGLQRNSSEYCSMTKTLLSLRALWKCNHVWLRRPVMPFLQSTWMMEEVFQFCSALDQHLSVRSHSNSVNPSLLSRSCFTTVWKCFSIPLWVIFQVVSRRSELLCAGWHDRDSWLFPLRNPPHAHQQQALQHHGVLPPAAQQVHQGPEGRPNRKG